jgi:DnaJ-domain-containing protein 1
MSFARRVIDSARSGLNSIVDKVAADDTPLSHVSESDLHHELEDRKAARKGKQPSHEDNPVAKMAGASAAAHKLREKAASERERRILGARRKREKVEREAHERSFREAKARAAKENTARRRSRPGTSGSSGKKRRRRTGFPFQPKNDKLSAAYKQLEIEEGSSISEIKSQFRKLMRKYHPDRHAGNPKKQKAATELTMRITSAYNVIDTHLSKKK